jgi:hypothetical protein
MFIDQLITNINQVNPLIWFGAPLSLLGASSKLLLKFNKTHHTDKVNIIDKYDAENFNNVIKPLYETINALLVDKAISVGKTPTTNSLTNLKAYEERKNAMLKDQDFSLLEESIDFTELQDEIISSRRNKYDYNKTYGRTRRLLVYGMLAGTVHAVVASLFFIFEQVQHSDFWSRFFVVVWAVMLIVDIALVILYIKNESRMDGYIDA